MLLTFLLFLVPRRGAGFINGPMVSKCAGLARRARRLRRVTRTTRRLGFATRARDRLRCVLDDTRRLRFGLLRFRESAAFAAARWRAEPKCNFCLSESLFGLRRLLDARRLRGLLTRVTLEICIRYVLLSISTATTEPWLQTATTGCYKLVPAKANKNVPTAPTPAPNTPAPD